MWSSDSYGYQALGLSTSLKLSIYTIESGTPVFFQEIEQAVDCLEF